MEPYQTEYIENLRSIAALSVLDDSLPYAEWSWKWQINHALIRSKRKQNMDLLRREFQRAIDHLFDGGDEARQGLYEFAEALNQKDKLDVGLSVVIHTALLSYERAEKNRDGVIRELYRRGMALYEQSRVLIGVPHSYIYSSIMRYRLCFTEGGAYLKYFDSIESEETKGYIIRSMANRSIGYYPNASQKVAVVRRTLQVLTDDWYRSKAPGLPWDRFLKLTHQQMLTCRSVNSSSLTPQDLADIMESSHVIYDSQMEAASRSGGQPNSRWLWPHYELEYMCGSITIQEMLGKMETLIDQYDPSDYSVSSIYSQISLPMMYSATLRDFPDKNFVWKKRDYLRTINERAFRYVKHMRATPEVSYYLNQFVSAYIEPMGSSLYGQVLLSVMARCVPDVYVRSRIVSEAAEAICASVLDDDPRAFDDLPAAAGPGDADAAVRFIRTAAMLHDAGMIYFSQIHNRGRDFFREEHELLELHTVAGYKMLSGRSSTKDYADVALGHHSWYDGTGGYPAEYRRRECPSRRAVDVIALAVYLEESIDASQTSYQPRISFDEAVTNAIHAEGRRFYPLLTACLTDDALKDKLRVIFTDGTDHACQSLYNELH